MGGDQKSYLVCPRIVSTDVNGLSGKIVAETDLRCEPPDHRASGEASEAQDNGGPTQDLRCTLTGCAKW